MYQYDPNFNEWRQVDPATGWNQCKGKRPLWLGVINWRNGRVAKIQHAVRKDTNHYLCGRAYPPRANLDYQMINPRYCKHCIEKLTKLSPEEAAEIIQTQ